MNMQKKKIVFIRIGLIYTEMIELLNYLHINYDVTLLFIKPIKPTFIKPSNSNVKSDDLIAKLPDVKVDVIEYKHIPRRLRSLLKPILIINKYINRKEFDLHILPESFFIFLLKIISKKKKYIYFAGHPAVGNITIRNVILDINFQLNSCIFDHQLILNPSIIKKFRTQERKYKQINPYLSRRSLTQKTFNKMDLLYIGTLECRRIEDTIVGFNKFFKEYDIRIQLSYTIIGAGHEKSVQIIKSVIKKYGLEHRVKYLGWQSDEIANHYFNNCNIGVGYVPIKDYYINNYSFKVIEYLLSGMAVIATKLSTSKKIVNEMNGVLIDDNPDYFYEGLVSIYNKLSSFNSELISASVNQYKVGYVYQEQIFPYLEKIINKD